MNCQIIKMKFFFPSFPFQSLGEVWLGKEACKPVASSLCSSSLSSQSDNDGNLHALGYSASRLLKCSQTMHWLDILQICRVLTIPNALSSKKEAFFPLPGQSAWQFQSHVHTRVTPVRSSERHIAVQKAAQHRFIFYITSGEKEKADSSQSH